MTTQATGLKVNGDVLKWARETLALSINTASEKSGISNARLMQLEKTEKQPTLEELKKLSGVYKRSLAALLLQAPPLEKPFLKDFRTTNSTKPGSFSEKTIMAVRKARALASAYLELKSELELFVPKFTLKATLLDDPKAVASRVSPYLRMEAMRKLPDDKLALEYAMEMLEEMGVITFQLTLTEDDVRGFAICDEPVPIIGLKGGGEKASAKLFSLFHEFGHILLRESAISDVNDNTRNETERWCNAFAAELLVPQALLKEQKLVVEHASTKKMDWKTVELEQLGKVFHVGPLMVLRCLLTAGYTTKTYYAERHKVLNKPSFGISKNPTGITAEQKTIKEKGRTFVTMAFNAFDKNRIDALDLSGYLGVSIDKISKTRELLRL